MSILAVWVEVLEKAREAAMARLVHGFRKVGEDCVYEAVGATIVVRNCRSPAYAASIILAEVFSALAEDSEEVFDPDAPPQPQVRG